MKEKELNASVSRSKKILIIKKTFLKIINYVAKQYFKYS